MYCLTYLSHLTNIWFMTVSPPIPAFNGDGLLPAGDYILTLAELQDSQLVNGPAGKAKIPNWDMGWRMHLVENPGILCRQLWQVGISEIYVDGSFVEDKCHPNDIDGYFECDLPYLASGHLERDLNLIDPYKVWTWDPSARRACRGFSRRQLPMWHVYRVELYPHVGQLSGLRDKHGNELEFPSAFRLTRGQSLRKGIVKIGGER